LSLAITFCHNITDENPKSKEAKRNPNPFSWRSIAQELDSRESIQAIGQDAWKSALGQGRGGTSWVLEPADMGRQFHEAIAGNAIP